MRERGTTAFNAFIATLAGILIVATATYLLLVATEAMTPEDLSPSGWLRDSLSDLRALSGNQETLAIIALAGLGVVGAFILLMQVLPAFARERRLYGTDANGNRIMLGNDSVQRVIDEAASEVTGVQG
ncbi:MAG TPA: hypothetical protein VNL15_09125, partial [Dehalococcoidia bacterium]|nr:hypothetical protein [Dehalococcoidia bacterium]